VKGDPAVTSIADPRFRAALVDLLDRTHTSQAQLAKRANVSRSHVCQLVAGARQPSRQVALALDTALGADGTLAAYVTDGEALDVFDALEAAVTNPRQVSADSIAGLAHVLAGQRVLDDSIGSANVIEPVTAQLAAIAGMVREVIGPNRPGLVRIATQWAQFAGWLNTSVGRWDTARAWFATGSEWAAELGDPDLAATLVSYHAGTAWLTGQWAPAIALAEAATADQRVYPGQRAYDTYAAARGYALYGELDRAERLIDSADVLYGEAAAWPGEMPVWHHSRGEWERAAERGLVRLHMARHDVRHAAAAVTDLRTGVDGIPEAMAGAAWAAEYQVHLATAHLLAGEPEPARTVLDQAATIARATRSQRVLRLIATQDRRLRAGHR
jgi:transcriptional regulator with XRE-family HTH domain